MKKKDESMLADEGIFAGLSADILKGRQSVRTTFRLPTQIIELLSVAASQLGLKQKSLFDQLVEDQEVLTQLAQLAEGYQPVEQRRQQKTYVVSRNALVSLEHVARECGLPRDLLVELSIQRLVPVLSSEQEKNKKRQHVLEKIVELYRQSGLLLEDSLALLGEGDVASQLVANVRTHLQQAADALSQRVEQGRELDRYQ